MSCLLRYYLNIPALAKLAIFILNTYTGYTDSWLYRYLSCVQISIVKQDYCPLVKEKEMGVDYMAWSSIYPSTAVS